MESSRKWLYYGIACFAEAGHPNQDIMKEIELITRHLETGEALFLDGLYTIASSSLSLNVSATMYDSVGMLSCAFHYLYGATVCDRSRITEYIKKEVAWLEKYYFSLGLVNRHQEFYLDIFGVL